MRNVSKSGIAALVMVALSAPVAASTLTFDGDICDGGNPCFDGLSIDQDYGDTTTVDVSYATLEDYGVFSASVGSLSFWGTGYSDLTNVAYPSQNGAVGQIAFVPMAGYSVTLSSFDLGTYFGGPEYQTDIYVYDASASVLWTVSGLLGAPTATTFLPDITSSVPIFLQWGTNFNVGLDNIVFSSALIDSTDPDPNPNVIPLPAAGWMLLAGLGGLAAFRRRR